MQIWCSNELMVRGPDEEVDRFKTQAVGNHPWRTARDRGQHESPLNFHSLVPIPGEILRSTHIMAGSQWAKEHWGVICGARDVWIVDDVDGLLIYTFDTVGEPPVEFLKKVSREWPALTFVLEYEERSNGFKGLAKFHGDICEDHRITL